MSQEIWVRGQPKYIEKGPLDKSAHRQVVIVYDHAPDQKLHTLCAMSMDPWFHRVTQS